AGGPPPPRRRRRRWVPPRLCGPRAPPWEGAEGGCVAHHSRHGRGRDRRTGAAALSLARRHGAACRLRPDPAELRGCGPSRLRTSLDRDPRALRLLQRALRGPDVLGTPRARRRRASSGGGQAVIDGVERALVLAPHTDDGEFGCGATMARLVEQGADVRYVAFSIATRSLPEGFAPDTLAREVREATAELGIPAANLTVHDFDVRTFPEHRQEILELLIQLWNEWEPDCVFQPSLHDVHQD